MKTIQKMTLALLCAGVSQAWAVCPDVAPYDATLKLCANATDAYGPFTDKMTANCVSNGGGSVCSATTLVNLNQYGVHVALQKWSRIFAANLRGTGVCPVGTTQSAAHDNLCLELKTGGTTDSVYGNFSADLVNRCLNAGGGNSCYTNRWSAAFYNSIKPVDYAAAYSKATTELQSIVNSSTTPLVSLSVAAVRGGEMVYNKSFGSAWVSPYKAATTDTMYRIASVSKMVTAVGALKLVEQGRLSLDADIRQFIGANAINPYYPSTPVTVRMLLNHTSTINDAGNYNFPVGTSVNSKLYPQSMWFNKKPGTYFSYMNLNYGVLGTVMEKVTNQRFDRLMKDLVLTPVGMRGGFYPMELSTTDWNNVAVLYRKTSATASWVAQADSTRSAVSGISSYVNGVNATPFSPQGGLRTGARDLARLMKMLANNGTLDGVQYLKPETVALMKTPTWTYNGTNGDTFANMFYSWGLGAQIFTDYSGGAAKGDRAVDGGGLKGFGHLGQANGLVSGFIVDPATKNGVIYLVGGSSPMGAGYYSAFYRPEERIMTSVFKRAVLGNAN